MSQTPPSTGPNWTASLYRASRAKTIAVISLAVIALGGVGVLAGALFDADTLPLEPVDIAPEGSGGPKQPLAGQAFASQVEASPSPTVAASPTAVPTAVPTDVPTAIPTVAPTVAPSPSPTAGPAPTTGITLGGGVVTIPLPSPWQGQAGPDGTYANLQSGQGDWIYAQVNQADPATATAEGILSASYQNFFPPENYAQMEFSSVQTGQPSGTILGFAFLAYRGNYVDAQGSMPIFGNMWVALRQDGAVFIATAESSPMERFDLGVWDPVIRGSFDSFANPTF